MPRPIRIRTGEKGPRTGGEVESAIAVAAPALLVKGDAQPRACGAAIDRVDAYRLPGRGGGPIRVALGNTVDRFVGNIDELAVRGVVGIDAKELGVGILYAGASRGTDPLVLAYHRGMIGG